MKKTLMLILAICMIMACSIPAGATAEHTGFAKIYQDYTLGTTKDVTAEELKGCTINNGNTVVADDVLNITWNGSNNYVDLRISGDDYMEPITTETYLCLFSVEMKTNETGLNVRLAEGSSSKSPKYIDKITINKDGINETNLITAPQDSSKYTYTPGEWVKINVLTDTRANGNKYYFWLGDATYDEALSKGLLIGEYKDAVSENTTIKYMRLWVNKDKNASFNMSVKNYSVTPLVARKTPLSYDEVAFNKLNSENILGEDGFKSAEALGITSEGATASYELVDKDSDLYKDGNVVFPLFESKADVKLTVTAGDETFTDTFTNITFPSGYNSITRLKEEAGNGTADFVVDLRNAHSGRYDELIVIAAAYDSDGKIIKITTDCTLINNAFVANFGENVTYASAEVFVWQDGTLRPVK